MYLNPLLQKWTLLDTTILLISMFLLKQVLYVDEMFVFGFQYRQIL